MARVKTQFNIVHGCALPHQNLPVMQIWQNRPAKRMRITLEIRLQIKIWIFIINSIGAGLAPSTLSGRFDMCKMAADSGFLKWIR